MQSSSGIGMRSGITTLRSRFRRITVRHDWTRSGIRIHVREGKFLAAYRVDDDEVIDIAGLADVPDTIEASYELISRLLDERPYEFAVEYDATWAYPKRIRIVESKEGQNWVNYSIRRIAPDTLP